MDKNTKELHEEEEEILSLSNFPLNSNEPEKSKTPDHLNRRSSSEPSDFFEFFNNLNEENISHAEDIIFRGKLIPYKNPNFDDRILKSVSDNYNSINFSRRFCESLPEQTIHTNTKNRLNRGSRSLDCRKIRRNSSLVMKSEASDINRSFSRGSVRSEPSRGSKPRWYGLLFGVVRFPPEMDIKDIKNRQVRRSTGSLFSAAANGGRRRMWGHDWLRVLSCKSHASVAVAATSSMGIDINHVTIT